LPVILLIFLKDSSKYHAIIKATRNWKVKTGAYGVNDGLRRK